MIDYLVLLLSTDWFLPNWSEIGIEIGEAKKTAIQRSCREIVGSFMGGVHSYYLVDLSHSRKHKTEKELRDVIRNCGALQELSEAVEGWSRLSHAELTASWWYANRTSGLVQDGCKEGAPKLIPSLREVVVEKWTKYRRSAREFPELCRESTSEWDIYTQGLTDPPEVLGDLIWSVSLHRRFRSFWIEISQVLTEHQLRELKQWYRAHRKDRLDLIPLYVGRSEAD